MQIKGARLRNGLGPQMERLYKALQELKAAMVSTSPGQDGNPIRASAAGKVVYAGSGLRGYGKLLILQHDEVFLSAYAHNRRILVEEGRLVKRGQTIAEMGDTDANSPRLHFEIRRNGKPVDPLGYLPDRK